jgi:hypothetical protein
MRPAIRLFFLLVACWVTATACSDTSTTDGATQSGSADAATDTGGLSGLTDLGKIGQDTDSAVLDIADGGSGDDELGQPCQEPSDCKSGWCVQGPSGKVCSKPCSVNCEPGWTCSQVQVPGTTDTAFICLPKYMHLCQPCANSAECNDNGGLEHKCMPFGDAGSFCGVWCDPANPSCPDGYACQEEVDPDTGKTIHQCLPQNKQCTCSPLARSRQAFTTCTVKNEFGSCSGKRICGRSGLSACNAATPAQESCNGIDDDCDGNTDELDDKSCSKKNEFGTCSGGKVLCTENGEQCSAPDPKPETCNGYDDDCDGKTDEALCDDGNPCTIDTCNSDGSCKNEVPPDASCNDGDACTSQDKCIDGKCVGGGKLDCDDGNACTTDACDVVKGCITTKIPAGGACADDGNPCTSDTCDAAGVCKHSTQTGICVINGQCVAAGTIDPSDPCKVCNPLQSKTAFVLQNGLSCDDGDACTVADKCTAGKCLGKAMDCSAQNGPCTQGVCSQGACITAPKPGPCDDGNLCTSGDTCVAGVCTGTPKSCSGFDSACKVGVCEAGVCTAKPKAGSCSDGNPCTVEDACDGNGGCKGVPMDCSALDGPCGKGMCQSGQCIAQSSNSGGLCDDGNPCTTGDTCSFGQCVGKAKDCSYLNNACGPGICAGGQCTQSAQGICTPGQTESQSQSCGSCGTQTRTRTCTAQCGWSAWSSWGTCSSQGTCVPGTTESQTQGCGNCGTQTRTRTCTSQCGWGAYGSWSTCTGQGECKPGDTSSSCTDPCAAKVCKANCTWGTCGLKPGAECLFKGGSNYQCCGTKKWQFCAGKADGGTAACHWYPCQATTQACF